MLYSNVKNAVAMLQKEAYEAKLNLKAAEVHFAWIYLSTSWVASNCLCLNIFAKKMWIKNEKKNLQSSQVFLSYVVGQIAPCVSLNIDVPLKDCLAYPKLAPNFECLSVFFTSMTMVIVETYTKPMERKEKNWAI